jgi:hypothetical protein
MTRARRRIPRDFAARPASSRRRRPRARPRLPAMDPRHPTDPDASPPSPMAPRLPGWRRASPPPPTASCLTAEPGTSRGSRRSWPAIPPQFRGLHRHFQVASSSFNICFNFGVETAKQLLVVYMNPKAVRISH